MFLAMFATCIMFVAGGIVVYNDLGLGLGLMITSPLPTLGKIAYNNWVKEPPPSQDPVAPTPDEPSAV